MSDTTIVTCLYDIGRDKWKNYCRPFEFFIRGIKNILTLENFFVVYTDNKTVIDICSEHKNATVIYKPLKNFEKFDYCSKIKFIMESDDYKTGHAHCIAPEYCNPEYSLIINSKIDLINEEMNRNVYKNNSFMWLDAAFHGDSWKPTYYKISQSNIEKFDLSKLTILCRNCPETSDLAIKHFYKSHINRFAAGVLLGNRTAFINIKESFDKEFDICLDNNLIDSEQSILSVISLKNPNLFNLYHNEDWWGLFDILVEEKL